MTKEFFNTQFSALLAVYFYAQKMPDEGQDVYWEMLKDIPQDKFAAGVRQCLAECKFFPTIAELGEASLPAQTRLSGYFVQTRNGPDRVPLRVTWKQQIAELQRDEAKAIEPAGHQGRKWLR